MASAGSIWNSGNWHWEEKNLSKSVTGAVTETLLRWSCGDFSLRDVTVTGEASQSIRKAAKLLCFELNIQADILKAGEKVGSLRILELDQDSLDDFEVQVTGADGDTKRQFARGECFKSLSSTFVSFVAELDRATNMDMEEDRRRREEAAKASMAAQEKTGALQEQLLVDVKSRENVVVETQGSVWNANSYHWEERQLTSWAQAEMKKLLSQIKFIADGFEVVLYDVGVDGEASSSVRKGKALAVFDLTFNAGWKAVERNSTGTVTLDAKGSVVVRDFCNDGVSDAPVSVSFFDCDNDVRRVAATRLKKALPAALLKAVAAVFVPAIEAKSRE